jgi:hypothetical protein
MKPEHHLKRYRDHIKNAQLLKPIKINSQSGEYVLIFLSS